MGKAVKPIKNIDTEVKFINHIKYRDERVYIYWLIARSGAFRSTEVLNLKVADIKRVLSKGHFDFIEQKTGKKRNSPIENEVARKLKVIIQNRDNNEVLLPSQKGYNQALTHRQMQRLIVKYGKECLINDIGTHTPRKTSAYHLYMETGDIEEVKELLGHEKTRDTYMYIDAIEESKVFRQRKTNNPFKSYKI